MTQHELRAGPKPPSRLLDGVVTRPIEVDEQPWSAGFPTELVTGASAGGRIVRCGEAPEITELFRCFPGRYGADRDVEFPANYFGDGTERDSLLGCTVIARPRDTFFQRQPEQPRGITPMHGRPAILTFTDIAGVASFARDANQLGH